MHSRINTLLSICVALIGWEIVVRLKVTSPLLIPSPHDVLLATTHIVLSSAGLSHLGYTLMRCLTGLLIGVVGGSALGLMLSSSERLRALVMPWIHFVRSIPAPAFIPLFLLLFGIGEKPKIMLIMVVVGLLMAVSTLASIQTSSPIRRLVAKSLGMKPAEIWFRVLLPDILPHLSTGFKLALSLALILASISEMFIGTKHGIGRAMLDAQLRYETPTMYAYIFISGIIGSCLNTLYTRVEKKYIHWMGK